MNRLWGYTSAIIATIFFGIWNTFSKILLTDLDPISLTALVYSIAGVFLLSIHFSPFNKPITRFIKTDTPLEDFKGKKDYLILIVGSIIGTVIAPILFLSGLNLTTAVNASLLMNVEILFIIIIGLLFLKEVFKPYDIFGFLFIIIGAVFLTTNGTMEFSIEQDWGSLLIIAAAFFWSIDNTLNKFLSYKEDILLITAMKSAIGGGLLLLLSIIWGLSFYVSPQNIPYLLFIALISVGCSFILIYVAIRIIGATRTGSLYSLASLFGAVFAFLILKEPFTIMQLLFGLLMLCGVYVFYLNSSK